LALISEFLIELSQDEPIRKLLLSCYVIHDHLISLKL